MKLSTKTTLLTITLMFLSGCAFTNQHMALNYQTAAPSDVSLHAATKAAIHVGPIADVRDENLYLIIHKENTYGKTSGGYLSNEKVSETMQNAIATGLKQIGYKINNQGYVLTGDLTNVTSEATEGWVKGTLIIKTSV